VSILFSRPVTGIALLFGGGGGVAFIVCISSFIFIYLFIFIFEGCILLVLFL
jgi:hypothetical protein